MELGESVKPPSESEEGAPQAKQSKMETEKASSSTFDIDTFNLKTTLENLNEKIRFLEERIIALEEENVKKQECDSNASTAGGSAMRAPKRKPREPRNNSTSSVKRFRSEDLPSLNSHSQSFGGEAFQVDSEGFVMVYTDGACPKNGFNASRAGIGVWFNDQHPMNVSRGVTGRFTNNSAEIEAATVAVQTAARAGIPKLSILTDSQFLISCMTQWLAGWKRKGWKTIKNEPVIVKDEIIALEKACTELKKVKWVHVRGHAGVYGNERADELARLGAGM